MLKFILYALLIYYVLHMLCVLYGTGKDRKRNLAYIENRLARLKQSVGDRPELVSYRLQKEIKELEELIHNEKAKHIVHAYKGP